MQQDWKLLIDHLYQDFINFFLPKWEGKIDFSRPVTFLNSPSKVVEKKPSDAQENLIIGLRFKDQHAVLLLLCLEHLGYENKGFGQKMFRDFVATMEEVEFKIPTAALTIFLANSLPPRHEQYEYDFLNNKILMNAPQYIVREQYLDDLWEMVNPITFAVAACRLRLENEQHPKGRFESKILLTQKLLERYLRQRINIDAVSTLLQFIGSTLNLNERWETEFRDETKAFIAKQNSISEEHKAILLDTLNKS